MQNTPQHEAIDWSNIKMVVFDVDGTLYNQRALRIRMAKDILLHALRSRDFGFISVIKTYRHIREGLGDSEAINFESRLLEEVAAATGYAKETVLSIINDWIENRPLPYLMSCRFPGVAELFEGLKRHGKIIGVFSDYPAHQKLAAMGLTADYVVSATDASIKVLKPHPKGLEFILSEAGVTAAETLMIGDRVERDGMAAQRAGVRCLIFSAKTKPDLLTCKSYHDPIFAALLLA